MDRDVNFWGGTGDPGLVLGVVSSSLTCGASCIYLTRGGAACDAALTNQQAEFMQLEHMQAPHGMQRPCTCQ